MKQPCVWVVERKQDGEWLPAETWFTREAARDAANYCRRDVTDYVRVRKYVRAEG